MKSTTKKSFTMNGPLRSVGIRGAHYPDPRAETDFDAAAGAAWLIVLPGSKLA